MAAISIPTESYTEQVKHLPKSGRQVLAQFDGDTIIVYQAYRPDIGAFGLENKRLGGSFRYSRMSWIKTSFLWMMYRSGWGTKVNQEIILAFRIRRQFFDWLLSLAVPSVWDQEQFSSENEWSRAIAQSMVRVQWDPDRSPAGGKLERRAIQLGLRGSALERFGKEELLEVIDLTSFVKEQHTRILQGNITAFEIPIQRIYLPDNRPLADEI